MIRILLQSLVLLVFLGLWTWKLLEPYPVPDDIKPPLDETWNFIAAKSLHLCAYAFLAFLAMTLPVARRWKWCLVGLLALHGVGTEIGQRFVPPRTGSPIDVLIDWCGISLGVLVWYGIQWGVRTRAARRQPAGDNI